MIIAIVFGSYDARRAFSLHESSGVAHVGQPTLSGPVWTLSHVDGSQVLLVSLQTKAPLAEIIARLPTLDLVLFDRSVDRVKSLRDNAPHRNALKAAILLRLKFPQP